MPRRGWRPGTSGRRRAGALLAAARQARRRPVLLVAVRHRVGALAGLLGGRPDEHHVGGLHPGDLQHRLVEAPAERERQVPGGAPPVDQGQDLVLARAEQGAGRAGPAAMRSRARAAGAAGTARAADATGSAKEASTCLRRMASLRSQPDLDRRNQREQALGRGCLGPAVDMAAGQCEHGVGEGGSQQCLEFARAEQFAVDELGGHRAPAHGGRRERGVPVGYRDPLRAEQDDLSAGGTRGLAGGDPAVSEEDSSAGPTVHSQRAGELGGRAVPEQVGERAVRGPRRLHGYASTAGASWPTRRVARPRFDLARSRSTNKSSPSLGERRRILDTCSRAADGRGHLDQVVGRARGLERAPHRPGLVGHAGRGRGEIRVGRPDRSHDHAGRHVDQRRCPNTFNRQEGAQ